MSNQQEKFKKWLEKGAAEALKEKKIKKALEIISAKFIEYFPNSKIWFAEKLGKRVSYITGAGKEKYLKARQIPLENDYIIFIQNKNLSSQEEKILEDCVEIITYLKE
ncbi:MAG: hypothetical protein ACQESP_11970 [Candidatus Muiribacteriota bacterium]